MSAAPDCKQFIKQGGTTHSRPVTAFSQWIKGQKEEGTVSGRREFQWAAEGHAYPWGCACGEPGCWQRCCGLSRATHGSRKQGSIRLPLPTQRVVCVQARHLQPLQPTGQSRGLEFKAWFSCPSRDDLQSEGGKSHLGVTDHELALQDCWAIHN